MSNINLKIKENAINKYNFLTCIQKCIEICTPQKFHTKRCKKIQTQRTNLIKYIKSKNQFNT